MMASQKFVQVIVRNIAVHLVQAVNVVKCFGIELLSLRSAQHSVPIVIIHFHYALRFQRYGHHCNNILLLQLPSQSMHCLFFR